MLLIFFGSQCKIQGKINAKIYFGHNFWLEGHTDLMSIPLSYICHALFRDTQLGHVYRAQPNSQIVKLAKYLDIWLFGYLVRYVEHTQVGYPWKEHEKCSSEVFTWGPYDPPVKSYGQNRFLRLSSLVFYIVSQKNKQHVFLTFFIPRPKDKMATNGKINTNPSGSSLGEQLVAKRLTLMVPEESLIWNTWLFQMSMIVITI